MSNQDSKQSSKRPTRQTKAGLRVVCMIVLALICIGGIVCSAVSIRNEKLRDQVYFVYSGDLQKRGLYPIKLTGEEQKTKVKKTKRHGQLGKFQYYCVSDLRMQSSNMDSTIRFGNVSTNDCVLVLSVVDAAGHLLYRSGGVEPGNYISRIRLSQPLEDGTYDCRAYVAAYDRQTFAYLGAQYSALNVIIGG